MSYVDQENIYSYFVPMSAPPASPTSLAATADITEWICVKPVMVHRLVAHITTAVVGTTSGPQVVIKKRPTPGSTTGQTTVLTLTAANGTAAGKMVYKDVEPLQIMPGQSILISTVSGVGGTPAGAAYFGVLCENSPKTPMENSNMVASV